MRKKSNREFSFVLHFIQTESQLFAILMSGCLDAGASVFVCVCKRCGAENFKVLLNNFCVVSVFPKKINASI